MAHVRTALLSLPLALVLSLSAGAQDAKPFLLPVSLQIQQVEVVLGSGQGAKGFALPPAPAGLCSEKGPKDTLFIWVGHGRGKTPLSEWTIQAHLDGQGLLAIPRAGKEGVRRVEGGQAAGLVPAAGPAPSEGGLLLGQASPGGRLYRVRGGKAAAVGGGTGAAGVAVLGGGTLLLTSPGAGGSDGRVLLSAPEAGLFVLALEGLPPGEVPRESGRVYKVRFVPVGGDSQGTTASAGEAAGRAGTPFISPSGAAPDPRTPGAAYFATLGGEARDAAGRHLDHNGRVYRIEMASPTEPSRGGTLTVLLDGGEGVVSPAALAADAQGRLLVGEAPTFPVPGRDTGLWQVRPGAEVPLVRLAEVNPRAAGRREVPGSWAIAGVADASASLGPGWWLLSVQTRDAAGAGQVLALRLSAASN